MTDTKSEVLSKPVTYSGERISVESLEKDIHNVRSSQNAKVGELKLLREKNASIQGSLAEEIKKLRKFSDYLHKGELKGGFLANLKEILSYIPGLKGLSLSQRSIEELLRQQYEISARRVKEAATFSERLQAAEQDLFDEIERLDEKIIEAAKNEEIAAEYVLKLRDIEKDLTAQIEAVEAGTPQHRELQAEHGKVRRLLAEHSASLKLYHTSEERLARLKENTNRLAKTIGDLGSDIRQYVNAASEKLDLVAGQIQAIGTAADASVVMLELKQSLDVMTKSMNETTQFVSETQIFFRQNLDNLMEELELYDSETQAVMDKNIKLSDQIREQQIDEAVNVALEHRTQTGGDA